MINFTILFIKITLFHAFTHQGSEYPLFDYAVYAILSLSAGLLTRLLPETSGLPMPETLQDIELLANQSLLVVDAAQGGKELVKPKLKSFAMPQVEYDRLEDVEDASGGSVGSLKDVRVQRAYNYKDK